MLKASLVAGRYGVSASTVKSWIKAGLLPNAVFVENVAGSIWLIPESDLENFVKTQIGRPPEKKLKKN